MVLTRVIVATTSRVGGSTPSAFIARTVRRNYLTRWVRSDQKEKYAHAKIHKYTWNAFVACRKQLHTSYVCSSLPPGGLPATAAVLSCVVGGLSEHFCLNAVSLLRC